MIIEVIQYHCCGYIPILLRICFNGLFWMGNLLPPRSLLPQCNNISLKNYTTINTIITPLQLPQKPPCVVPAVFMFIIVTLNICCIVVAIVGTVIAVSLLLPVISGYHWSPYPCLSCCCSCYFVAIIFNDVTFCCPFWLDLYLEMLTKRCCSRSSLQIRLIAFLLWVFSSSVICTSSTASDTLHKLNNITTYHITLVLDR